jgi:hypothetical protein
MYLHHSVLKRPVEIDWAFFVLGSASILGFLKVSPRGCEVTTVEKTALAQTSPHIDA